MLQRDNRHLLPYVYEPLLPSQIRLLMPTDDEDGLSWTLQVVTLDDELQFEALSYTWGAQDETFPITLNGRRHHVHRNLFTALPNIARRNTFRPEWITVKGKGVEGVESEDYDQDEAGYHNREVTDDKVPTNNDADPLNEDMHSRDGSSVETSDADRSARAVAATQLESVAVNESSIYFSEDESSNDRQRCSGFQDRHDGTFPYASKDDFSSRDDQSEASSDDGASVFSVSTGDTEVEWGWEKASGRETKTSTPVRPIWIDALCVNQHDHDEKLIQLASMARVYREAAMVWVCLEPPVGPESVDHAIELLPTIVYAIRFISGCPRPQNESDVKKNPHVSALGRMSPKTLKVLKHLLGNPWFRRVWVIQEYSLAKRTRFLYGTHVIPQELVQSMGSVYLLRPYLNDTDDDKSVLATGWGLSPLFSMVKVRYMVRRLLHRIVYSHREQMQQCATLLLLISSYTNTFQDCLLPQDRVFGILGLLTPRQYEALGEDLFAIKEISSLYTSFTAALLPLAYCDDDVSDVRRWLQAATARKDIPGLPSWVPDLHHGFAHGNETIDREWSYYLKYNASSRACYVAKGQNYGELIIRGTTVYNIDAVHTKTSFMDEGGDERIAALFEWEKQAYEFCSRRCGIQRQVKATLKLPSKRDDHYWQTLLGPRYYQQQEIETRQAYIGFHTTLGKFGRQWKKTCRSSASNAQLKDVRLPYDWARTARERIQDPNSNTGQFATDIERTLTKRRLFRTACGAIGHTSEGVVAGDKVCVFNGLSTPHVLRRVSGRSTEAYTLIGHAYVHGLMGGEVDGMGLEDQDILLV